MIYQFLKHMDWSEFMIDSLSIDESYIVHDRFIQFGMQLGRIDVYLDIDDFPHRDPNSLPTRTEQRTGMAVCQMKWHKVSEQIIKVPGKMPYGMPG